MVGKMGWLSKLALQKGQEDLWDEIEWVKKGQAQLKRNFLHSMSTAENGTRTRTIVFHYAAILVARCAVA